MRACGRLDDVSGLRPGDHVCLVYASDGQHRSALTAYFLEGLARDQKLVYFAHGYPSDVITGYLDDAGVPAGDLVQTGRLTIVPAELAYARDGGFDRAGMLAAFRAQTELALSEGYSALRAAGEMAWTVPDLIDGDDLASYEFEADQVTAGSRQVGLCLYDARAADPQTLMTVAAVHPAHVAPDGAAFPVPFSLHAGAHGTAVLRGEVDISCAGTFHAALAAVARTSGAPVIDMSALRFIDVAGLRTLVEIGCRSGPGAPLVLTGATPTVRKCLSVFGIDAAGDVVLGPQRGAGDTVTRSAP